MTDQMTDRLPIIRGEVRNYTPLIAGYVVFVAVLPVLKLAGVIDWSWLGVLAPLWVPFAVASIPVIVLACVLGCWVIVEMIRELRLPHPRPSYWRRLERQRSREHRASMKRQKREAALQLQRLRQQQSPDDRC